MTRVVKGIDELKTLAGQEVGCSEWQIVSQDRIDRFAEVSGDHQWIHVDVERARKESPYHTTIAHGFLTVALLSKMVENAVDVHGAFKMRINYGFNRLRFTGAVLAESRVRGHCVLNSVKDFDGGVEVAWGVTVEVEGQPKPALVAEWLVRTYY
jgi:acyl dehydratase